MNFQKKCKKNQKKWKKVIDFREGWGYKPVCRRDEARLKKLMKSGAVIKKKWIRDLRGYADGFMFLQIVKKYKVWLYQIRNL